MKNIQKLGGYAAMYLAASYLIGMLIFLVVLDYASITDAAQKAALIVAQPLVFYATNLLMYVLFGFVLVVLALALRERMKDGAPALTAGAAVVGLIWAGGLIASGMVSNAGIAPVVDLYARDPAQAAATWLAVETVSGGLSGANGEILGGVFTLLVSLAGLRTRGLPKGWNMLGLVVGAIGIVTTVPGLQDLTGLFGLTQLLWFVGLGLVLLRRRPAEVLTTAPAASLIAPAR